MNRFSGIIDGLRSYWENLTQRERLGMGVLGGVAALLIVLLPVYFLSTSIDELEQENAQISAALRRMSLARGRIAAMRAEQAARDARYESGAPGEDWLPAQVREHGLAFSRVQDEPERVVGRYRIRTTRASFQGAGLRSSLLLLADAKNSRYPVAIERLHIDHHQTGDRYNLEVGVLTFERQGGRPDAGVARPSVARPPATPGARTPAGPPAP